MNEATISGLAFGFRSSKTYPKMIEYHGKEMLKLI
jgi:hypothetical protein